MRPGQAMFGVARGTDSRKKRANNRKTLSQCFLISLSPCSVSSLTFFLPLFLSHSPSFLLTLIPFSLSAAPSFHPHPHPFFFQTLTIFFSGILFSHTFFSLFLFSLSVFLCFFSHFFFFRTRFCLAIFCSFFAPLCVFFFF